MHEMVLMIGQGNYCQNKYWMYETISKKWKMEKQQDEDECF